MLILVFKSTFLLNCGVPGGTLLGLILCIVTYDDLPIEETLAWIFKFADDLTPAIACSAKGDNAELNIQKIFGVTRMFLW